MELYANDCAWKMTEQDWIQHTYTLTHTTKQFISSPYEMHMHSQSLKMCELLFDMTSNENRERLSI